MTTFVNYYAHYVFVLSYYVQDSLFANEREKTYNGIYNCFIKFYKV